MTQLSVRSGRKALISDWAESRHNICLDPTRSTRSLEINKNRQKFLNVTKLSPTNSLFKQTRKGSLLRLQIISLMIVRSKIQVLQHNRYADC